MGVESARPFHLMAYAVYRGARKALHRLRPALYMSGQVGPGSEVGHPVAPGPRPSVVTARVACGGRERHSPATQYIMNVFVPYTRTTSQLPAVAGGKVLSVPLL